MAKREALRDLQARLAKRLQAARSEGMSVSWLAVRSGGHNYLLPLDQSGEIVALARPQPVPYARAWFKGVINVRGYLLGVVELGRFVAASGALPVVPAGTVAPVLAEPPESAVVTLHTQLDVNCALQVDSLAGLRGTDAFATSSPPPAGAPDYFGPCHTDQEGQRWQEIDLRALAKSATFLSIGA